MAMYCTRPIGTILILGAASEVSRNGVAGALPQENFSDHALKIAEKGPSCTNYSIPMMSK